MLKDDGIRLKHMLDAAKEAIAISKGKSRWDFRKERLLNLSLVRLVEIVGEAAHKITPEFRDKHPQIPWMLIIGMRNRLIHGYDDIDFDILYKTVTEELPQLSSQLEKIVSK